MVFTKSQVDSMFEEYRENKSRVALLDEDISEMEKLISELEKTIVDDSVKITASMTGMPFSGRISDPTAEVGARLADGEMPEHLRNAKFDLEKAKNQREKLASDIHRVDAMLISLNGREALIVKTRAIDGYTWENVINVFYEQYKQIYSISGIRGVFDAAMGKIYRVAGTEYDAEAEKPEEKTDFRQEP